MIRYSHRTHALFLTVISLIGLQNMAVADQSPITRVRTDNVIFGSTITVGIATLGNANGHSQSLQKATGYCDKWGNVTVRSKLKSKKNEEISVVIPSGMSFEELNQSELKVRVGSRLYNVDHAILSLSRKRSEGRTMLETGLQDAQVDSGEFVYSLTIGSVSGSELLSIDIPIRGSFIIDASRSLSCDVR